MARKQRYPAITLIEMLVALVITTVMAASIAAVFMMSMKIWTYSSLIAQTSPPANILLDTIDNQLRQATNVVRTTDTYDPSSTDLQIVFPAQYPQGTTYNNGKYTLQEGGIDITGNSTYVASATNWIKYFLTPNTQLTNEYASQTNNQQFYNLWSKTNASGATTHLIADDIVHFKVSDQPPSSIADPTSLDPILNQQMPQLLNIYTSAITLEGFESSDYNLKKNLMKNSLPTNLQNNGQHQLLVSGLQAGQVGYCSQNSFRNSLNPSITPTN